MRKMTQIEAMRILAIAAANGVTPIEDPPSRPQPTQGETTMAEKTNVCRVPNCGKATSARGLCAMHLSRALSGKDAEARAEALKYLAPPQRKRRLPAGKQGRPALSDAEVSSAAAAVAKSAAPSLPGRPRADADDVIAVASEIAQRLGAKVAPFDGGVLVIDRERMGEAVIYVTAGGVLRTGRLDLDPAR